LMILLPWRLILLFIIMATAVSMMKILKFTARVLEENRDSGNCR
jgi:hypothetical protein